MDIMQAKQPTTTYLAVGIGIFLMTALTVYACLVINRSIATMPQTFPVATAQTPVKPYLFPGGHHELEKNYRFVAIYGSAETEALGVLGHQSPSESVARVKKLAQEYQSSSEEIIYPTFEIITTTASAGPGKDGTYSRKSDPKTILPWIEAAEKNGVYIVLDLQPGRESFLKQAKRYESLLRRPNVGLALDAEWRLKPNQVHLEQIGAVSAHEINQTSQWLSDLIVKYRLPQKMLLFHQFQLQSFPNIENIKAHKNLLTILQMDGQGSQGDKNATYHALIHSQKVPEHILFGWKNFYKEDKPTLSPKATMNLSPKPRYVSYQ